MHGGLTQRYMLPAGLGVPLAAGWILPRFDRRLAALVGVLLGFGLAAQFVKKVAEIFRSWSLTLGITSNSHFMGPLRL